MTRWILLDAGVIGLLYSNPLASGVVACLAWLNSQTKAGSKVVLTDLTDFEARRELLRRQGTASKRGDSDQLRGATSALRRLDDLHQTLTMATVTSSNWRKAAEFWAFLRVAGQPTAAEAELDGDAILAAVSVMTGDPGDEVIIATTNMGHLTRFPGVDAREWQQIT